MTAQPDGSTRFRAVEHIGWILAAAATTGFLLLNRQNIGEAHIALAYLLIVLGASTRCGRPLGFGLALLCFLSFNFFFIQPYYALTIHNRLDYLVLLAFLITSAVATQLLHRAQTQAEAADRRAHEIDRLAALGAESLNAPRAEDAVTAIATVILNGLNLSACEIYLRDHPTGGSRCIARVTRLGAGDPEDLSPGASFLDRAEAGRAFAYRPDGSSYEARDSEPSSATRRLLSTDARSMFIPLVARETQVGTLRLESTETIALDSGQQRFAEALAYYAALTLERVQLQSAAEQAEALREADRVKDALLASVSHDLRTPLTTIKAVAHDIAMDGDDRAIVVEEEADRLNRFVSDLLDLSRLNGSSLVTTELVAVEDVIGVALQQLSGASDSKRLRAVLDPAEPLLVGRLSFVDTLRAVVNLIENAIKYSPEDSAIDISARREGEWIVLQIADRGPGVASEDRKQIFEPFFRGSRGRERLGTGLGLAIARRSAELQGGSLDYAPRQGGGSVFTLRLPAVSLSQLQEITV
jgi:two-component system, OmpR family, sensor histidine kinase KdpD